MAWVTWEMQDGPVISAQIKNGLNLQEAATTKN